MFAETAGEEGREAVTGRAQAGSVQPPEWQGGPPGAQLRWLLHLLPLVPTPEARRCELEEGYRCHRQ